MSKKSLPVIINPSLKMECWTYYKMAILQTLPEHMNWLAAHMNLYYGDMGEGLCFGSGPTPHPPEYFCDILNIEEIDLFAVRSCDIVNRIKSEINNNYYFVVFLRYSDNVSHESFIYGYDDSTKVFKTVSFGNSLGIHPSEISYDEVQMGYHNDVEFFKNHPSLYYIRRSFGYVMSRIQPVKKYLTKNYAFEFFDKINQEVYGKKVDVNDNSIIHEFSQTSCYYTGTACLYKIQSLLTQVLNEKITPETTYHLLQLRKTLFKLLEHRKLMHDSMMWEEKNWNITDTELLSLRQTYLNSTKEMERLCLSFLKFEHTLDFKILETIVEKIKSQHHVEKQTLGMYSIRVREWYCNNVLKYKL